MTGKKTKFLAGIFLVNIAAAAVFLILVSPSKPIQSTAAKAPQLESHWPEQTAVNETASVKQPRPSVEEGIETEKDFLGEVRDWARKDPEAALEWAQHQPDSDESRKEALTDACFQIDQTDPERAVMLAERFRLSKSGVLVNLAQQWASKDLRGSASWVADQPEGDERNALVTGVTFVWSQSDPVGAAQFVLQVMSPGSAQDQAVMMVLHQWALTDLAGASGWAQQFPASPLRSRALSELSNLALYKQQSIPR